DLGNGRNRLGGSALAQVYRQLGDESPDVEMAGQLRAAFLAVQELIGKDLICAGHDRSDGGLITSLLEMAFSGNCGLDIDLLGRGTVFELLFSEELGLVVEVQENRLAELLEVLETAGLAHLIVGRTTVDRHIRIACNGMTVLDEKMVDLRSWWEETSYQLERLQINPACADEEKANIFERKGPAYHLSFNPEPAPAEVLTRENKPKVAILRDEGSNSDREMTSAFYLAGFEPWDICMNDLLAGTITLDGFQGLAAVGGFSYADVPESAKGWAATIRFNQRLQDMFLAFYNRPDTFSLGICNGCQLFSLLGWVPRLGLEDERQPRFIHNLSGRFESRWTTVRVQKSRAMMLAGMDDLVFGIHVDHGEGRLYFPDMEVHKEILAGGLAPIFYADDEGNPTEAYPFNPNGSPGGLAGLCSADGRHLAMMPHPERVVLPWQAHYLPENMKHLKVTPWMQMFRNAYDWCISTR
ncbi:MAG: phosphoribosylformylglycinamidine synthase subunit PurQ, partial [Desulfoprunum sp.]|nr:phosphoribosylformylglycinamidine synthase subunit PurQ [Desulfoprunum sp.]